MRMIASVVKFPVNLSGRISFPRDNEALTFLTRLDNIGSSSTNFLEYSLLAENSKREASSNPSAYSVSLTLLCVTCEFDPLESPSVETISYAFLMSLLLLQYFIVSSVDEQNLYRVSSSKDRTRFLTAFASSGLRYTTSLELALLIDLLIFLISAGKEIELFSHQMDYQYSRVRGSEGGTVSTKYSPLATHVVFIDNGESVASMDFEAYAIIVAVAVVIVVIVVLLLMSLASATNKQLVSPPVTVPAVGNSSQTINGSAFTQQITCTANPTSQWSGARCICNLPYVGARCDTISESGIPPASPASPPEIPGVVSIVGIDDAGRKTAMTVVPNVASIVPLYPTDVINPSGYRGVYTVKPPNSRDVYIHENGSQLDIPSRMFRRQLWVTYE